MTAVTAVVLLLGVGVAWLASAAFVRLRDPLDRLHCVTFLNCGGGLAVLLAAVTTDGASARTGTMLLTLTVMLLGGAAASFAVGRALRLRGSLPDVD